MKNLVERFALYLLRKVRRSPVEVALGNKVLFCGRWWTVSEWSMRHDGILDRVELNFTAIRHGKEDMK